MLVTGPYSLTQGTLLQVNDPTIGIGSAAVQIQNNSAFFVTVLCDGVSFAVQPFMANTLPVDSQGVVINPTANPSGASANEVTLVWLLNGERSTTPNGSLTTITAIAGSYTFSATGATQSLTVPSGVFSMTVDMAGAGGGPNASGVLGGLGARVQATLSVLPGATLTINIGKAGTTGTASPYGDATGGAGGGANAGEGGGSTGIRAGSAAQLIAAGGGGAGQNGSSAGGAGGAAGTSTGSAGGSAAGGGTGGGGGTQSAGGAAGTGNTSGNAGTQSAGGAGATTGGTSSGGGGGGGWWGGGGGGGAGLAGGGGGGGGSSYQGPNTTGVTKTAGYQSGDGYVTFSYSAT